MRPVTLTFDNGPTEGVTEEVLDILADEAVKATFFMVGRQLQSGTGQQLAEHVHAAGHRVGNHTYSHTTPLGLLDASASLREIERTQDLLGNLGKQMLFRPFGDEGRTGPHLLSKAAFEHLTHARYTCVLWNVIPRDWDDPDGWVETARRMCADHPWPLVVLHDIASGAMRHLPRFLQNLRSDGFEPVIGYPDECLPIVGGTARAGAERYVS